MRGVDALLAVVGHGHGFGEALGLVVDAARADRVDVAPVALGLRVDQRVAVDLGGGGQEEPRALELGQAERVVRAERADLERLDREAQVVDGAGRAGQMEDEVDAPRHVDELGAVDVAGTRRPSSRRCSMFCERARVEVVDADDAVALVRAGARRGANPRSPRRRSRRMLALGLPSTGVVSRARSGSRGDILVRATRARQRQACAEDREIEPDATTTRCSQVETDHVGKRRRRCGRRTCQSPVMPGSTTWRCLCQAASSSLSRRGSGTRPDQAHVAAQHVDELGQLVDAELRAASGRRGVTRGSSLILKIAPSASLRASSAACAPIGVVAHGAELVAAEAALAQPDPSARRRKPGPAR